MGEQLALVLGQQPQHRELVRRQLHRFAGHRDRALLEIDDELADPDDRVPGRPCAPHRRSQASEELVDAERLRHVVVGACVESRDLLALLADGREDQDRDGRPGPELSTDLDAASVRQDEVEDHRLRWLHGRDGQCFLCGRGGDDVVAGSPQGRLERAQDLRLVVDHEHPGTGSAHAAGSDAADATGSASANEVP